MRKMIDKVKNFKQFVNESVVVNNLYSKESIYNNIIIFLNKTFYSGVKYNDLINSCELSKGNCMDVSEELHSYLINIGYKNITLVDLYEPKFSISKAHSEYLYDDVNIFHEVVKIGDYYVDLTGSQFSPEQGGVKIYTKDELYKLWGKIILVNENNKLNKSIITESFLSSQSHIYEISKEIVSNLSLNDIINYLIDDIENVNNIEILLNDYKINCQSIFYKWSQKENIDDDFSSFLANSVKVLVMFTNKLRKDKLGELVYNNHLQTTIYINYNDQKANDLLYTNFKNRTLEPSKEDLIKLVKQYILPSYINSVSHELRHLYDDYRTNNKIDNNDYINVYGDDYLNQTSEIWARFTEILNDIKKNRIKIKDFNSSHQFLLKNFNGFDQLPIKLRSKLTSYLYRYINN